MILVGCSGWSYDDWVGPVYAPALRTKPGAWLAFYAERFPTVEINSTFYRLPAPRVVAGWLAKAARLPGAFEFSAKVPEAVTHAAMVGGDAAAAAAGIADFRSIVAGPLAAAGRFGAALLQLSPHFRNEGRALATLDAALADLAGLPVAVEFRHRTWAPGGRLAPEARELLAARGAALAAVDGPGFPPIVETTTADHAYLRFHGRRADAWFRAGRADEDLPARYDYEYGEAELAPWAEGGRRLDTPAGRVRVYFNNHVRGQAFRNAGKFATMTGAAPPDSAARRQRALDDFGRGP